MKPYPIWKYLAPIAATVLGVLYSLPNLYLPDPAVQVSGYPVASRLTVISDKAVESLKAANIPVLRAEMGKEGGNDSPDKGRGSVGCPGCFG